MVDISFDVPEYYNIDFKGLKPKYCPECKKKMKYDGWGSDGTRIDEYWFCKKCNKMYENP